MDEQSDFVKVEISGITKNQIKEMVDEVFGSCVWGKFNDGTLRVYPTLTMEVIVRNNDVK